MSTADEVSIGSRGATVTTTSAVDPAPDKDSLDGGDGFDHTVKRQNRDSHARLEH